MTGGFELDEVQELRNVARKQAHWAAIQWEAFNDWLDGDRELCLKLMELWYRDLLASCSQQSLFSGMSGMFTNIQEMFGDEDEE